MTDMEPHNQSIITLSQAVEAIKTAILQGQYEANKDVNRYKSWQMLDADSSVATDKSQSTIAIVESFPKSSVVTDESASVKSSVATDELPMGVATYTTAGDMPEELRKALPDMEDLKRILSKSDE